MNDRQFGPRLTGDGAQFRLWAPAAKRVDVLLDEPHAMKRDGDGWFTADIAGGKTSADITKAYLARIEALNPHYKAVISVNPQC